MMKGCQTYRKAHTLVRQSPTKEPQLTITRGSRNICLSSPKICSDEFKFFGGKDTIIFCRFCPIPITFKRFHEYNFS